MGLTTALYPSIGRAGFDQLCLDKRRFILHFWAPWNAVDYTTARRLRKIHGKAPKPLIFSMNVEDPELLPLLGRLRVRTVPTVLLFQRGLLRERIIGLATYSRRIRESYGTLVE